MNIQNDEEFLGNCTTNAFYLADTRGLNWKRYCSPCVNSTNTSNDPVLAAYSLALKSDVLSVWRRIPLPNVPNQDLGTRIFDCTKELYIFWFGEEPVLQGVPGPSLQEVEYGSFDSGINTSTLDLFFKAIHNIIERNLLNGDFVRLGKWFVKPVDEDINHNFPDSLLGFNFSIFIHGKSSVVATVDIQEKSCVAPLTEEDLVNLSKHPAGSASKKVLLAPYGLNAYLTGNHLPDMDAQSMKLIDEWKKFFPANALKTKRNYPAVVEVVLGEIKMLYPSSLILVPVNSSPVKSTNPSKLLPGCNDKRDNTQGIVDYCWKCAKEREEMHSPTTQLWDFKPLLFQSACSCCSSSNITRVKANINNPFSSNVMQAKNNQNASKQKKDTKSNLLSFHQRIQKKERIKTCVTPSLLTGRSSTPLLNNTSIKNSIKTETSFTDTVKLPEIPEIKVEKTDENSMVSQAVPCQVSNPCTSNQNSEHLIINNPLKSTTADIPKLMNVVYTKDLTLPSLPVSDLDPRLGEELHEPEPPDEKPPIIEILESISIVTAIENEATTPEEALPKKGVGRPRGKKRSPSLSGLSQSSIGDDIISPGERRSKRLKESPLTSPAYTDSGPGRPQRRPSRISSRVKTPQTPKTENQAFNFSQSRDTFPFPSPPPSHFSPTIKSSSLTTTKDLVPISADLEHLFDEDEDEGNKKGHTNTATETVHISAPAVSESQPQTNTKVTATSGTNTLTQQDLAQMFPTPPSPPKFAMSPTSVPPDIHITGSGTNTGACMEVLSPEMQHAITVSETDHIEINLETRSPITDGQVTFSTSTNHLDLIPEIYKPLSLPSEHILLKIDLKRLKYTPTWDDKNKPPVLHRRPSNNRFQSASFIDNLSLHEISKVDMIPDVTQFTPIEIQNNTCTSILDHGSQSLIVNLAITDSFLNWINITQNALENVVQEETYKLFTSYQDVRWRTVLVGDGDNSIFPEDTCLIPCKSNVIHPISKPFGSIKPMQNDLPNDLLELLLKHFHSPYTLSHFIQMYKVYYKGDKKEISCHLKLCKQSILSQLKQTIQNSLQQCVRKSVWDSPKIEGPLSFQQMNSICNSNGIQSVTGTNPLSVTYENDVISVAPESLGYWQTLLLEPFAGKKNIAYIVATPGSEFIVHSTKQFFKEFNSVYESMNLGSHIPIVKDLRYGLFRINQNSVSKVASASVDDWFSQDPSKIMSKMKTIAQFCKHKLGPYVSSLGALDLSQLITRSDSSSKQNTTSYQTSTTTSSLLNSTEDPKGELSENLPTSVFIYIIDPFHKMKADNYPLMWSYTGMMRCFIEMCSSINGKLKENVQLQVIPLEQILQVNLKSRSTDTHGTDNKKLKSLAFSVYSQTRQNPIHQNPATERFMTSFGVGNLRKNVLRRRQVENTLPDNVFTPPFILTPPPTLLPPIRSSSISEIKESISLNEDANILFCCYTLSWDCHWLLVCCVDQCGELFESTIIKILYPKKEKHKHLIWSVALRKLWEYLNSIISYTVSPWRVVLTKYGNMGQHELKELNVLLDKNIQNILPCHHVGRPISPLSDSCIPCSVDESRKGKTLIKSISLLSLHTCQDFSFYAFNTRKDVNGMFNRIYVMPSPKRRATNIRHSLKSTAHDFISHDTLLGTEFDDDHTFMQLSPSENSIFQTSPQNTDKLLTSPPNTVSPHNITNNNNITNRLVSPADVVNNVTRLGSPFQPISVKQNVSPVKNNTDECSESLSSLCVGYLLSAISEDQQTDLSPQVLKAIFYNHVSATDESAGTQINPFDAANKQESLRHILEKIDALSWLNIDPSDGKRSSGLPVHIQTLTGFRDLLRDMMT